MKRSIIFIVLAALVVIVLLGWLFIPRGSPSLYDDFSEPRHIIRLDLVYFLPKDVSHNLVPGWKTHLEKAAEQVKEFYLLQLEDSVDFQIHIYPKSIIGENATAFYNGEGTDGGNPHALLAIEAELRERFPQSGEGVWNVLGIIFEGVGASGSGEKRTFLLAREFLTREKIKNAYGLTFFAHEFGHAIGFPDSFDGGHEVLKDDVAYTDDDLMGAGRYKPLSHTYLSDETKKYLFK